MNLVATQLAQSGPNPRPTREHAMKEGFSLLIMVSLLGVLVVTMLSMWMVLRSSRRKRARPEPVPTDISVDAWAESARRMDETPSEFDEDL